MSTPVSVPKGVTLDFVCLNLCRKGYDKHKSMWRDFHTDDGGLERVSLPNRGEGRFLTSGRRLDKPRPLSQRRGPVKPSMVYPQKVPGSV